MTCNSNQNTTYRMASNVFTEETILRCPICLDIFDRPKLLSCGHSFCLKCITQLQSSARAARCPFVCPECRRNVLVPHGGLERLPPNFVLQRLLDDRDCSDNAKDPSKEVDSNVENLADLISKLEQNQTSLEARRSKFLIALQRQVAVILKKGDEVKRGVDDEVGQLLQTMRSCEEENLARVRTCHEHNHKVLDEGTRLWNELRQVPCSDVTKEESTRLTSLIHELIQRNIASDNARMRSLIFSPTSDIRISDKNLVGHLEPVDETEGVMEASIAQGKAVWGMTVLDNTLYVLRDTHGLESYIDLYDAETLSHIQTPGHFPRFRAATDLASSRQQMSLYVPDETKKCVFKLGVLGGCAKWSVNDHKPWCVSVSYRDNVLVSLYDINVVMEFRADGKCLRQLCLDSAEICHLQQVLQVVSNQFLVCHATRRISVVDSDGRLLQSHGGMSASTGQPILGPSHLSVDRNHMIYAADVLHRRVLVYSPTLNFTREVVSTAELKWWPIRLYVDNNRHRLYVADNNFDGQKYTAGRVAVFSLR